MGRDRCTIAERVDRRGKRPEGGRRTRKVGTPPAQEETILVLIMV